MADSRKPGYCDARLRYTPARTRGPLGVCDAGDPDAKMLVGDTPGPLGQSDHADPGLPSLFPNFRLWGPACYVGDAIPFWDTHSSSPLAEEQPKAVAPAATEVPWEQTKADFVLNEGSYSYMYLDTRGYVTVGVGKMLPDVATAQKLAFVVRTTKVAASAEEIKSDFEAVKKQPKAHLASWYQKHTKLDLPDAEIDKLLKVEVAKFEQQLKKNFKDYDKYPAPARRALLDMAYNLGIDGLLKFKKLKAAAEKGDWKTAAAECHRNGPSDDRNDWTKARFLEAAAPAKPAK